jgi:lysozyme
LLIVDLSSNNGSVDFVRLKKSGIAAAWMKVTEGRTWDDPNYHKRAAEARKAGLRVGGYHYGRPDTNSPKAEAAHFAASLGKIGRRDLRPVLDFEQSTNLSPKQLEIWARDFNQEFRKRTGLLPAFYSYPAYIQSMQLSKTIGNGLWLASYGRNDGKEYPMQIPSPWKKAIAHQFTSSGNVVGVKGHVDVSKAWRLNAVLAHPVLGLL